jgi:hypothetical protein
MLAHPYTFEGPGNTESEDLEKTRTTQPPKRRDRRRVCRI